MAQVRFRKSSKQRPSAAAFHRAAEYFSDEPQEEFHITSTSLDHDGRFLRQCTSDGPPQSHDLSPAVEWHALPSGTEALALVMDDVDTPDPSGPIQPFTHWVLVNIPAALKGLPAGFFLKDHEHDRAYEGMQEGVNDFKVPGYRGPSPPSGDHRYEISVYALDGPVNAGHKVTKEKLLDAMAGHVLAEAHLAGHYGKGRGHAGGDRPPGKERPQIRDSRSKERDLWGGSSTE